MTDTNWKRLSDHNAFGHPAFDSGLAHAIKRAHREHTSTEHPVCISVYYDGDAIFVRDSKAAPPPNSKLICIAQWWDKRTVQVRYDGARSEFVGV